MKAPNNTRAIVRLLLALTGSIFFAEIIVMMFIGHLPPLNEWHKAILDASLLLTLLFPVIYFLSFRPLKTQLNKQLEAERIHQETIERLGKIAGRIPGIVFQLQMLPDGTFQLPYANENLYKIYRITQKQFPSDADHFFASVHPDDLSDLITSIKISARDLTAWEHEYRLQFTDNSIHWLMGTAIPQHLDDNSILWHGFITDITKRKQTEIELKIAAIAFESQEGMVITNTEQVIIKVNQAFLKITGYSNDELINQKMNILKSGHHDAEFYADMWHNIIRTGSWQGEIWNKLKNNEVHPEYVTITAVKNDVGEIVNYIATYTDITERKIVEEKVNKLAFYDPLTKLPNRVLLADRMHQTLAHCRRNQEIAAVCMMDLDGFKQVNDRLGHAAGDRLLCDVAIRLQDCIREEDTAARIGGDEFALLLAGFTRINECEQTLSRIIASVSAPYYLSGHLAHISASIGVTLFPEDSSDPDILLRHADQVMYEVKQAEKNGYKLFNPMHEKRNRTTQEFIKKIEKALSNGAFELYYQPIVDCRNGRINSVEALIRWNHPILGMMMPMEFIPLIEHHDLIIALGEWTIQKGLTQLQEWNKTGFDLRLNINVSARQLYHSDFPERLKGLLKGFDPELTERLEIEIIETAALEDVIVGSDAIRKCREMGIKVTLDDFGTGFSSLTHLKHMAVDTLKIDTSFISGMLSNPLDRTIVESVIGLANSFRLQVVAEGVEHIDQILMLMELGCYLMQGNGFSKPMPAEQIDTWLNNFTPDPLWSFSASNLTSRDYFELLLAEANHRCWIDRVIVNLSKLNETTKQNILVDHHQCRFGQWYYNESANHFRNLNGFDAIEQTHRDIHITATLLYEHFHAGLTTEAEADKAQLLRLQQKMIEQLHLLRSDYASL